VLDVPADDEALCVALPDVVVGTEAAGASTAVAVPDGQLGAAGFTEGSCFAF
jgi:hypothetical protein